MVKIGAHSKSKPGYTAFYSASA